jgi:hypothetical protein
MGLAISGTTPVNGTTQRGSEQMRNNTTFRADLANGNFLNLANSLNTFNGVGTGRLVLSRQRWPAKQERYFAALIKVSTCPAEQP